MGAWLKHYSHVLKRLIERREELKLSQDEVGRKATEILEAADERKLSGDMLGSIERGDTDLSMPRFLALCEVYRLHPMSFLDPNHEPAPEEFRPFIQDTTFRRLVSLAYRRKNRPRLVRILSKHFGIVLEEH
jgi:transcriptional regulator with XRE-family HTH domain